MVKCQNLDNDIANILSGNSLSDDYDDFEEDDIDADEKTSGKKEQKEEHRDTKARTITSHDFYYLSQQNNRD